VNDATNRRNCVTLSSQVPAIFVRWNLIHNCPPDEENNLTMMNSTEAKGDWNEQKGKLKQKLAVLTDNDLMFEEGKKDAMLGKIQVKLGKTKEELHRIIGAS
jgi:uncharacterized protein YjbJ (UPF0337 family)